MRNPADLAGRSAAGGSKTTPCCSKVGIKRGPWTAEEDEILAGYIKREGEGQWRTLPKRAGLLRCGKSCRLRWMNYLRPHLKRGLISPDEEDLILRLHRLLGNRWSLIAGRIPGRTDNEIKNYWNTHLSKKLISQGLDPRTHKPLEIYYNPNPNNHSSPISDPAFNNNNNSNNHHVIRSSPAQEASTNPNPILATPSNDPPPPPVILNQLQEASTSYVSNGRVDTNYRGEGADHHHDGSNYNDEIFSSFLDLDALIMNDDDVFPQPNRASTNGDDNQLMFQGQLSSSSMMMMMQQPMGYVSNFQGFDHCNAVWGSSEVSPFSGFSNQGNRNVDPEIIESWNSQLIYVCLIDSSASPPCICNSSTYIYASLNDFNKLNSHGNIYVSARFRMRIHI